MKDGRARDLAARKAALRRSLAERRAAAQAALKRRRANLRQKQKGEPDRRRRWWPILLALLLLLLLRDCRCEDDPLPPTGPVEAAEPAPTSGGIAVPAPPPPPRVSRRPRAAYTPEAPEALPWITALRLQVAARSPRLAACFVGTARPGALKWTAAVDPTVGRVSDQSLEPTLSSDPLSKAQRDCALDVLSTPEYRLEAGTGSAARSTPARVGLVIEF